MANPDGENQFQGFAIEAPYGDQKKNYELLRSAPISGAPTSGRALDAPERQREQRRRAAAGPQQRPSAPPGNPAPVVPQLPLPYEKQLAMVWQQLAAIPGASDLVKQVADEAAQQAQAGQAQGMG